MGSDASEVIGLQDISTFMLHRVIGVVSVTAEAGSSLDLADSTGRRWRQGVVMPSVTSLVSWIWIFAFAVLLAVLFLAVVPTGAIVQIAARGALLVGGAALVLGLRPSCADR